MNDTYLSELSEPSYLERHIFFVHFFKLKFFSEVQNVMFTISWQISNVCKGSTEINKIEH